jgi:putative RNA 2'-phosphotransferase
VNNDHIKRKSKKLSWLLRHGANEVGLDMDAAGWANATDVMRILRLSHETLGIVVRDNNKSRLQWEGDLLRCCQGHSTEGTPVTQDALEATWQLVSSNDPVWHGTRVAVVPLIAEEGIQPQRRTHVHLAESLDARTGKRAGVSIALRINPSRMAKAGFPLFQSPNGVILARHVPPSCIDGVVGLTRKGRDALGRLEALFGLAVEPV